MGLQGLGVHVLTAQDLTIPAAITMSAFRGVGRHRYCSPKRGCCTRAKELAPDAERRELAMVPLTRNERIIDNILTKYIEMNAKTPLMLTSAYDFCSVRFANAFCWSARSITAGR